MHLRRLLAVYGTVGRVGCCAVHRGDRVSRLVHVAFLSRMLLLVLLLRRGGLPMGGRKLLRYLRRVGQGVGAGG